MSIITFPGLGLEFHLNRVAFHLLGRPVYWYGVIIAIGFLLAVGFCMRRAARFGMTGDDLIDMLLFAVPLAIVGARLYYIIFYLDFFTRSDGSLDWPAMLRITDGGLAIYGGVIAAVATVIVFCKVRKAKVGAYLDIGAFGLLIGQAVGRWGNFMNAEAFGSETTLPWRMGVEILNEASQTYISYGEVHPTFLYESLWNAVGFILLLIIAKKWRKYDGQLFTTYVLWYGVGRAWIEGLRTDSLYFFGLELFGVPIRTSQVLAAASAAVAAVLLVYHLKFKKHAPEELYCNRGKEAKADDMDGREGAGSQEEE